MTDNCIGHGLFKIRYWKKDKRKEISKRKAEEVDICKYWMKIKKRNGA